MTPEKQRIAIAEVCGRTKGLTRQGDAFFDSSMTRICLPDYLNSLDAMHEAEKKLSYEEHCFYCDMLEMVVGGPAYMPAVRATAAQRAEAFLRTLNLWVEE